MTFQRYRPRQQGFSMLEVLIAVLVFSLGMIGLAGLLIFAIQSNHVAYLRTQATFLAHNMADRMGANPAALWAGAYADVDFPASTADPLNCDSGCTPAQLADYDQQAWSTQLKTFLPAVKGHIACTAGGLTYTPSTTQQDMRPPYGGTCTMTLTWNEAGTGGAAQAGDIETGTRGQQPHTFEWVFQP